MLSQESKFRHRCDSDILKSVRKRLSSDGYQPQFAKSSQDVLEGIDNQHMTYLFRSLKTPTSPAADMYYTSSILKQITDNNEKLSEISHSSNSSIFQKKSATLPATRKSREVSRKSSKPVGILHSFMPDPSLVTSSVRNSNQDNDDQNLSEEEVRENLAQCITSKRRLSRQPAVRNAKSNEISSNTHDDKEHSSISRPLSETEETLTLLDLCKARSISEPIISTT